MGALVNENGAVMINGRIHLVDRQYRAWSFCSCDKYEAFIVGPASFAGNEDGDCVVRPKTDYEGSGMTCRNHWGSCWWENLGNGRKVGQTLNFYYGPPSGIGQTVAQAAMRGFKYKYRFLRGWQEWPHRIRMKVKVHGQIRDTECREYEKLFDRTKGYKIRKHIMINRGWPGEYTFSDGGIKGQYWYTFSGITDNRQLYLSYSGCP